MTSLPSHARAVIIGGGIVGCSVAYHLTRLGWREVVLLERARLTSGSTHHAAGLVGQLRSDASVTQLLKHSVELYAALEAETGQATGWKGNGGLRLACTSERMTELARQATTARSFGLEMHLLSPREARELWPAMDISDVVGAAYLPGDGQINPSDVTQALAKGARAGGVRIVEDCPVKAIRVRAGRVAGVVTPLGEISAEVVVNCAGQWAREVGRLAGVNVPLTSVQHQYIVTEPIDGLPRDLPTLRDPDRLVYFKEEVGGLVMGGYERDPAAWAEKGIPDGFQFTLLDPDWDRFEPLMAHALERVPALEHVGVRELVNGPEAFTPDGNFILGESPELRGFFVAAGFNAFGIASAGGVGRTLAEWIVAGAPEMDLRVVDIRRFAPHHRDENWVRARSLELYAKHYAIAWPGEEHASGRPLLTSPLYERLRAARACFGEKGGWERPNWFAPEGVVPEDRYSFGRPNWFEPVGAEHRACRERAALFDLSSFAKFRLTGRDAEAALQWVAANDVAVTPGRVVYTQMLNARGGVECDLTVTRIAPDAYYIVTGTAFRTRDFAWIRENLPQGLDARLEDMTEELGVLALMGPRSREILARVTQADLSDTAFPFMAAREIWIAGVRVWALRVTYVGELGWELHAPCEGLPAVYDALHAAGAPLGLVNAGYRAIESLRLEKGYRAWGAELTSDTTPLEAGLRWAVKLDRDVPFLGREALVAVAGRDPAKRLVCFTVADPEIVLLGRETIYRDGARVGWLSSGGWGYTVGANIGYGYVRREQGVSRDFLRSGSYELDVAGRRVPATVHFAPLYDPANTRVRA